MPMCARWGLRLCSPWWDYRRSTLTSSRLSVGALDHPARSHGLAPQTQGERSPCSRPGSPQSAPLRA